jgi:PAS domain S-box-containing protein
MRSELRDTGISFLGAMPWGTHFCCFYDTKQDLIDTVVPYFKAGLETNEFCVWALSSPLSEEESRNGLRLAVPDLDRYEADGSLELLAGREWYLTEGHFNRRDVEGGWTAKLDRALAQGYDGIRVAGNALWFEENDWKEFCEYENDLNGLITDQRMTVLCTYPVAARSVGEILDIARAHQFAIAKRKDNWDVVETPGVKQATTQIIKLNEELEKRVAERTGQLTILNGQLRSEITERKQAEELMGKAREKVRMILDSITDRFFAFDNEWRITDFNKHGEEQLRALGKNPGRLIGKVLWDVFPNPPVEEVFRRAMSERAAITHEHYYPPLQQWVENRIYPSPDGGLAVFQRYITERKRAAAALRESEERYRLFVEGVRDYAIFMLDPQGRVTSWNKGAERIKGYRAEEIIGEHFSRFYSAGDIERGKSELALKAAAEQGHYEDEGWRVRKDGTSFFAHVCITALMDEAGRLRGFSKVSRDITEHKRAHEELRRSEAYLAEAERLSHTGSWAWNVSTGDLFWSQEHFRICGVDPGNFKPTIETARELIHPEDRASASQNFDRAISERNDFERDLRFVRPDGTIRYVHSIGHPVFDGSGALTEYVGTIIDNTERRLAEEALHKTQTELAHANRVLTLGEMATSIAHEMNQPLAAIVTNGDACLRWLRREAPDLDEARHAVEHVIENAMRASEVIKRIRSLVKKTDPQKQPLNLNDILREVIAITAGELTKNHVVSQMELQPDIPPVLGDRVQLQQVLLNLILNSNEAMSAVDWPVRELVITSQESKPGEVMVAVRDSGRGLGPDDSELIFDSFYSTRAGGLGLGLSISRAIIESHGGRLWATRNKDKDKGATFHFVLPAI